MEPFFFLPSSGVHGHQRLEVAYEIVFIYFSQERIQSLYRALKANTKTVTPSKWVGSLPFVFSSGSPNILIAEINRIFKRILGCKFLQSKTIKKKLTTIVTLSHHKRTF